MLEASGLGKRFGSRWIFRGISFQLQKGDRLAILGPNGSGKSTLLRVLCGLTTPSEGQVSKPSTDPRTCLGLATLEMALYPALTCKEHLGTFAHLKGCEPRAEELLQKVGLAAAKDRPAGQLSTGMKSRLKLALAIQASPHILILDEPGAALDDAGQALLSSICEEQAERGILVLATNDKAERRLANLELVLG